MRILLADDHIIVRQGLTCLLEREGFTVVAAAANGREAVELALKFRPDVAVIDIGMPGLNGLAAARQILQSGHRIPVVLLTMHDEDQYVLEALRAGVSGYVLKTRAAEALVEAIREVHRGGTYLSPGVSRLVMDFVAGRTSEVPDPLTARERQVLQLIAEGQATKQAAAALGVSAKTVESHRARIMDKLDIHDTAGLVRYAIRRGLIQA